MYVVIQYYTGTDLPISGRDRRQVIVAAKNKLSAEAAVEERLEREQETMLDEGYSEDEVDSVPRGAEFEKTSGFGGTLCGIYEPEGWDYQWELHWVPERHGIA